jgi:hypothetical protein
MCSTSLSATTSKPDKMGVGGRIRAAALAARTLGLDMMSGMKCDRLLLEEVGFGLGGGAAVEDGWMLAGDGWLLVCAV